MSQTSLPDYATYQTVLSSASLSVSAAETHGLLVGMLAGGLNPKDKSWQPLLFDYSNDGMGWPISALNETESLLTFSAGELMDNKFTFSLLLPQDDSNDALFERADAVCEWVNHFISGLGLISADVKSSSEDTKEALADLEEISKLGIDEDDDLDEQNQLLDQVVEHIKACVLTIHAEFGVRQEKAQEKPTLH
ncbi:YecA family protein [Vibrio sp.]|uniref:UPF0149 protein EES38_03915 n=1 Tax=Vibrio viridaestus TaxID=2487322 RepID=A0A3N9THK6_9VIBR|nr:YecA family protein [Vibrio viridaestus]MDC0610633.1 YecA family protein [Vibrio sp.]RQW63761.1 YecA family protein [Vibrio viridaestus]